MSAPQPTLLGASRTSTPMSNDSFSRGLDQSSLGLDLQSLELLHHFSTVVCFTLSKEPQIQEMWQIQVPKEAASHAYLMHCLLAISALHLVHTSSVSDQDSYRAAAVSHQAKALSAFRPLLDNITTYNCDALCASSMLVAIFATALPQSPGINGRASPLEGILEMCVLSRGVFSVIETAGDWIRKHGKMAPALVRTAWDAVTPLPVDTHDALQGLELAVEALSEPESVKKIHFSTIHLLKRTFLARATNPNHPSIVFMFLVIVDRQYIEFVWARQRTALVILAHFGVVLHSSRDQWWSQNWGYQLVEDIYRTLEADWRPLISWPMQKVGMGDIESADSSQATGPVSLSTSLDHSMDTPPST